MNELSVLQAIRLKGRVVEASITGYTGLTIEEISSVLADAETAGLITRDPAAVRLTPSGRARLDELTTDERLGVDRGAVLAIYDEFTNANTTLKEVVSAWQLRGPDAPNDHTDAAYDNAVIARLCALHDQIHPLLGQLVSVAPRLETFGNRLGAAAERVLAGEHRFIASPIVDSYHQVWFELHQVLIELLGRTREQEAVEGRA